MEKEAKKLLKSGKSRFSKFKRSVACRTLRDLIKAYRACTTPAEERALVKKEAAHIRDLFREGDTAFRRRNITKLLFFHMNGYPTDFGITECIKLCALDKFADKRVAYLGLMILVDETQSILMLMTNSLKQDLHSSQSYIIALALTVLGNTATAEMTRDLLPEVMLHINSRDSYIKKKAIMAAVRACRKLPADETGDFVDMLQDLYTTRLTGVQLSATNLIQTLSSQPLVNHERLASVAVPLLSGTMDSIVSNSDKTGNNVTPHNPFQQVKTLMAWRKVITASGKPSQNQVDQILHHVTHILSTVSPTKVIGCSVLYEAIRTVLVLPDPSDSMMTLVVNTLGTFLEHKDASVRYIALDLFAKLSVDIRPATRKHLPTIVACLDEPDPTMRRCAVGLAHILADETNVAALVDRLLEHVLILKDPGDVADTCEKIVDMVEHHAAHGPGGTSQGDIWQVDVFVRLLTTVDDKVPERLVGYFLAKLSSFSEETQLHAARCLYKAAFGREGESMQDYQQKLASHKKRRLKRVACYVYGEYGTSVVDIRDGVFCLDHVLAGTMSIVGADQDAIDLRLTVLTALVKVAARSSSSDGMVAATEPRKSSNAEGDDDLLSAMGLLTVTDSDSEAKKAPNLSLVPTSMDVVQVDTSHSKNDVTQHVLYIIGKWRDCAELETQERACEYYSMLEGSSGNLLVTLLSKMPPMDYKAIKRKEEAAASGDSLQMMSDGDDLLLDIEPHGTHNSKGPQITDGRDAGLENTGHAMGLVPVEVPSTRNDVSNTLDDLMGSLPTGDHSAMTASTNITDLDAMLGLGAPNQPEQARNTKKSVNITRALNASDSAIRVDDELVALGALEGNGVEMKDTKAFADKGFPNLAAAPVQPEPEQFGKALLFESNTLEVTMAFSRENPAEPGRIRGQATFENRSMSTLSSFVFKLSVRQYIKLHLKPASSRSIGPLETATQVVYFTNTLHGSKPIEMMYQIEYVSSDGKQVCERGLAKNLPKIT